MYFLSDRIIVLLFLIVPILLIIIIILFFIFTKKMLDYQMLMYSRIKELTTEKIIIAIREAIKRTKDEKD